jgi:hypothetical protein
MEEWRKEARRGQGVETRKTPAGIRKDVIRF